MILKLKQALVFASAPSAVCLAC